MPWPRETASSSVLARTGACVTSPAQYTARPGPWRESICSQSFESSSSRRAVRQTQKPSRASLAAQAAPIPELAPVTSAVFIGRL